MGFEEKIRIVQSGPLRAQCIDILQVNLGYRCNMCCKHCHLEAGPHRHEEMDHRTVEAVIRVLRESPIEVLDITGGAPEMNPHLKYLVAEAKRLACRVIVRTNLTILLQEEYEAMPGFYKDHTVEIIASLPSYMESAVDKIRGDGAFTKSIQSLRRLNSLGYGKDLELKLHIVYNPLGAFLAPSQEKLEAEYKQELLKRFNVSFQNLYAFANMPLGRFRDFLVRSRNYEKYMEKLRDSFNPATLEGLMCRHLLSVGWDGALYDCDFNQGLGLPLNDRSHHIEAFDYIRLGTREIMVGEHCYGCTAGQGST